ncbi:TPR/glycosyl transferase domain protein [Fulvivirga imtechensis AK7]|uniref:TPR/glycosyl transferase domain protein n=2 Tax=Fulvivirga TaxID=396811 RepID=L8JQ10_9BACT|nr:TPR/glycosyl transferase domain protein [Fulvivirga imtechensis AK7]
MNVALAGVVIFVAMKKVLVITYYWPPSGGSGVQRWLKFVKYLPEFGWQPIVFTPENPSFDVKDLSLEAEISPDTEIIKLPIWEPYRLFKRIKAEKSNQQSDLINKKAGFFGKLLLWIRGNLFIPDPRVFWVRPASRILQDLIIANGIDVVITTGPPHSMHLIGLKLKRKLGVSWVADFRDTWTTWVMYESFYLSQPVRRLHKILERKVLKKADVVIAASRIYANELAQIGGRKVEVITNGYDPAEFSTTTDVMPENFVIRHVGVVDELRDPRPLLRAVAALIEQEDYDIQVEFIGNVNATLRDYIAADEAIKKVVSFKPYVAHSEVFDLYRTSAGLLLLPFRDMKGNIPGKLFEYLAAQRPILYIGPAGDSVDIIQSTGSGFVCEAGDVEGIKGAIRAIYTMFEAKEFNRNQNIEAFSRIQLTQKLSHILQTL